MEKQFYRVDLEGSALVEVVSKRILTNTSFPAHVANLLAANGSACNEETGIGCSLCWASCIANHDSSSGMVNCMYQECYLHSNLSEMTTVSSSLVELFRFDAVNKAPDFLGSNLGAVSRVSYQSEPLLFSNWTRTIWRGRLADGQDAPDEQEQLLTFVVRARVPNFFEVQNKTHDWCLAIFVGFALSHQTLALSHQTLNLIDANAGA